MTYEQCEIRKAIENGKTSIGIELGSTRIKTVLIGEDNVPIAAGNHDWENSNVNNLWTYSLEDIWSGLQDSYRKMTENVHASYGIPLLSAASIGISGMMHGYLVFDKDDNLLTPFRTWRNNVTGPASETLTSLFDYTHSATLVDCTSLPGHPESGRTCIVNQLSYDVGWLSSLAN